jgi:hypothetical protein
MNMCGQKFSSEIGHKLYRKNPTRKEAPFSTKRDKLIEENCSRTPNQTSFFGLLLWKEISKIRNRKNPDPL